jgi:hypothetical protein
MHVGAGDGSDLSRYLQWGTSAALVVDADETVVKDLSPVVETRPGWHLVNALLGDRVGEVDYYLATNPSESAIFPPERLSPIWRNLRTAELRPMNAVTLETLIDGVGRLASQFNWAFIDCLPALPILIGAGRYLELLDVIVARVVLDDELLPIEGTSKADLDHYLQDRGYRCLAYDQERHPAIGKALYLRDWKASLATRLAAMQASASDQTQQLADRQVELDQLRQASEMHAALVAERDEMVKLLAREREAQDQRQQESRQWADGLKEAHELQSRLAQDCIQQVAQITLERDEQSRMVAELQQRVETVTRARDEHAHWHKVNSEWAESLKLARDEQSRLAQDYLAQVEELILARDGISEQLVQKQALVDQLRQANEELGSLASDRQNALEELTGKLDEARARLAQLESQLAQQVQQSQADLKQVEQLNQVRSDLAQQLSERQVALAELNQEREVHSCLTAELQDRMEQIGRELFERTRDLKEQQAQLDLQTQLTQDYLKQVEQITAEREGLAQQLGDCQSQLESLQQVSQEQATLIVQGQKLAERLSGERDENAHWHQVNSKWAASLKEEKEKLVQQVGQLMKEKDVHAGLAGERLTQIEKLLRERDEQLARITVLENERRELGTRQRMLDEEMIRAEAQIELIKDVLLRERPL